MDKSKNFFEEALKLFPGGVNSPARALKPYPFFIEKADGSKLYSVDGKGYIDYCLGFGPLILGHRNREVLNAVTEQLERDWLYGAPYEAEIKLAKKIMRYFSTVEMIRFVNSGTEATMNAVRVARGYTNRSKVIKFEGNYHGSHDNVLIKAGSSALTFGMPTSEGILKDIAAHTLVAPYNDLEKTEAIAKKYRGNLAAVIVEPIAVNMGLVLPEKEFLKGLREICDKYDALLIFDEVVTGFRLTLGGAQDYYGVKADLTTLGKIIGGGFPIGAFGGRREYMEKVAPLGKVHNAGTFNAHPISMAAGLKTIEVLEETNALKKASRVAEEIAKDMKETAECCKINVEIHQIASMYQVFFSRKEIKNYHDVNAANKEMYQRYHQMMMDEEVYMAPSQFETCFTSSAHSDEDVNKTIEALDDVLRKMSGGSSEN